MNIALIYNPASGRGLKKGMLSHLEQLLTKKGNQVTVYVTEYSKHTIEIVENLPFFDLVITMGGDGTFSEAVIGNCKRKESLVLAHLPIGTTNDIGMMYGYGRDLFKNIENLLSGEIKNVDICEVNGTPFLYSAGFGKFIRVSYDTPRKWKKKYGYFAYVIEAIKEWKSKTRFYELEITIDNKKILGKYSLILVSNTTRIAGIDHVYKDVKLNDKKFEVLLCTVSKKKDFLKGLVAIATRKIDKVSGFEFYKTNSFTVKLAEKKELSFSLDGEKYLFDAEKINFSTPKTMKMMVPKKNITSLME